MKILNLFDLDYTLIDSHHRSDYISNVLNIEKWLELNTYENIMQDTIIQEMYEVFKYLENNNLYYNVCITSRELTEDDFIFLKKHNISFDFYLHRGSAMLLNYIDRKNKLKDYELKDILLKHYLILHTFYLGFTFDDRDYNLDIFRKHNFKYNYNALDINKGKININDIIIKEKELIDEFNKTKRK